MSGAPVKVGFIGFGRQAEHHAKVMASMPGEFALTAVCDVTSSRQAVARDAYGMVASAELPRLLDGDAELVFITTNSASHHALTLQAAAAGKHLMVEKPLCMTAVEAGEMVDAARSHRILLSCFQNRRWDADARRVRRAVREGHVGEPFLIENRAASDRPAVSFGTPDFNQQWRVTRALGGGTIYDFGPHWIDQVLSIVPSKVNEVFADVRHFQWGDADDYFDVKLVFDGGCRATISKCDVAYLSWPKWFILGTAGTLRFDESRCLIRSATREFDQVEGDDAVDLYQNLYDAIRHGAPLAVTGDQAKRNIEIIDAAFRSAAAGTSVHVSI